MPLRCCAFLKSSKQYHKLRPQCRRAACLLCINTGDIPCSFTYDLRRSSNCSPFAMSMVLYHRLCKTQLAVNSGCFDSPAATGVISAALLFSRGQEPSSTVLQTMLDNTGHFIHTLLLGLGTRGSAAQHAQIAQHGLSR